MYLKNIKKNCFGLKFKKITTIIRNRLKKKISLRKKIFLIEYRGFHRKDLLILVKPFFNGLIKKNKKNPW